ncbi:MAG: hypothetical protein Ct9H90mP7_3740 [Candidatus Neomarinimicrobiota bacterium]|nr:MAG: hypothetical protein Ct9H90mP7_3740 [Candidatus Neomarinimicrobiota bacterium]
MDQLDEADQGMYNETVDSLLVCARAESFDENRLEVISGEIKKIARKLYAFNVCKKLLPEKKQTIAHG